MGEPRGSYPGTGRQKVNNIMKILKQLMVSSRRIFKGIVSKFNKKIIKSIAKQAGVASLITKVMAFSVVMAVSPIGTMQVVNTQANTIESNSTNIKMDTSKSMPVSIETSKPEIKVGESVFNKEQREANETAIALAASSQRTVVVREKARAVSIPIDEVQATAYKVCTETWGENEWNAFSTIIMKESGWNIGATNRSSGAYGLPQALPGSKMASAGSDWQTNPETQLRWMIGYIQGRYGSPSQALSFHLAHNWY